ncbi:transmembrane protease serine 9-like [Penaeus indicus]|uniref:transmembrane protease serine 9-like n=1 Tax=Penaeus indicus TaxID=29960 RepID=UPI00300D7077
MGLEEDIPYGGKAVASGWGELSFGGSSPSVLREVELDIITINECQQKVSLPPDTNSVVCALTLYKDTCRGDSGGPLVAKLCDGTWAQIGIVSYGFQCAVPDNPGVYTRVSAFANWISENTGGSSCSSTLTLSAELDNRAKEREAVNEAKNEVVRIGQELDGLETTLNAASGRRRRRRNLSLLQELQTALTNLSIIMLSRDVQRINSLSKELITLRSRLVIFTAEVAAGASGLDVTALLGSVVSAKQTAQNVTEVARQELVVLEAEINIIAVEFQNSGSTVPPLPSLEPEPTIKPTASPTTPPATNPPLTTPSTTAPPLTTPPPTTPPPTTPPPTTPPPTTPPPTTPLPTTPPPTTPTTPLPTTPLPTTPPPTTPPPTTPLPTTPPTTPPPTTPLPTTPPPTTPTTPLPTTPLPTTTACSVTRKYCEDCGVATVSVADSRIVGGADASSGEFPWQVGLATEFPSGAGACGGSLIKSNWVLSAAHCFFDDNGVAATSVVVQYGSTNLATATEVTAKRYITHENYDASSYLHDIALVELPQALDYANNPNVQPICLGEEEDYNFGGKVVATGWGYLSFDTKEIPEILQEVMLDLITTEDCKTMETLPSDTSVICALTTNKDTCSGDSGGPLFTQLCDGRWAQLGIVSYGFECARPSKPGVYTKVSAYFDWIETNSGESSSATPPGYSTESSSATSTGDSTEPNSVTSTGDSTESSSATSTGDSTESSSATSTEDSTESSSATSTGDSTESSSATSTGDSTESSSATSTGDSTESSSATSTGDSTESSSATSTGDSIESSSATPTGNPTESSSATSTDSAVTTIMTESSSTCSLTRKYCEDCGVASVSVASSRIVGGADASSGEFPWQVGLATEFPNGAGACGGSLIKSNWVLSAAHCFFDDNGDTATSVVVQYGSINLATATEVTAKRYITHENYNASPYLHDIALVELPQALDYANNPNVQPICLGEEEDYNFGGKVVATGWGYLSFDTKEIPEILQEVMLDLITTEDCKTMVLLPSNTSVICALTTNKDTCSGDSGGPLFTQLCDGRWAQLGIVSYGFECARPSNPGVYTKVSAYFDWIETNSGGTNC